MSSYWSKALKPPVIFAAVALLLTVGVFLAPPAPFIIDGGLYYDMARVMAEQGTLAIAGNGGVADAPPLTKFLTVAHNGLVYPFTQPSAFMA